jgi:hypothetical protein
MSNKVRRPDLRGVILQSGKVVGGLDLPDPREPFIEQFCREYARLELSVAPVDQIGKSATHRAAAGPVSGACSGPPIHE